MKIARWIKDTNPDESLENRVLNMMFALQNFKTIDGKLEFITERELIFWILSELNSAWQKIKGVQNK